MAIVKPFIAVRPKEEYASRVAALPYDVYNREEAKTAAQKEELSFLRIDRAETQFPDSVDTYDEKVYQKAKELYQDMKKKKIFIQDDKPYYYIYQLEMDGRKQTGIVACADVDDYLHNVIKKHENTREEKEQDRIRHVDTLSAQTGPIFLAYRSNQVINQVVSEVTETCKPLYAFTADDGIRHTVWRIDGEAGKYDGSEEFNYFLSVLFPDDQLMIMDYNRCVKDLNGLKKEEFLAKVRENFSVEEIAQAACPQEKGQVTMYLEGKWYLLRASEKLLQIQDAVDSLDVSILQEYLLKPVLGIENPRTDSRIDFVGGIRGLKELERRAESDMKVMSKATERPAGRVSISFGINSK